MKKNGAISAYSASPFMGSFTFSHHADGKPTITRIDTSVGHPGKIGYGIGTPTNTKTCNESKGHDQNHGRVAFSN